jgi:hypothetical protein
MLASMGRRLPTGRGLSDLPFRLYPDARHRQDRLPAPYLAFGKGDLKNLEDMIHEMEADAVLHLFRNVLFEFGFATARHDDFFESGAVSGQDFLFDPANLEDFAFQGDLAGHG